LVKHPEEWKWSSYRHYAFRKMGPVEVDSEWTARDRDAKITGQKRRLLPPPFRPTLTPRKEKATA
jgi:hypothetical protein